MKNYLLAILIIIGFTACNKPFSKYEKTGETDIEIAGYIGPVKQVDYYEENELRRTTKYNSYGFITEEMAFSGDSLIETCCIKYDERGHVTIEKHTGKTCETIFYCIYDEHGNQSELIREIKEKNVSVSKDTIEHLVYEYDDNGHVASAKLYDENGDCKNEWLCDSLGQPVIRYAFDSNGQIYRTTLCTYINTIKATEEIVHGNPLDSLVDKTLYRYDESGNIVYKAYVNNGITSESYDFLYSDGKLLRKTHKIYDDDGVKTAIMNNLYDSLGRKIETTCVGLNGTDTIGSTSHIYPLDDYDEMGNIVRKMNGATEEHYVYSYYK